MKKLIVLYLLLASSQGFCQDLKYFEYKNRFDWEKYGYKVIEIETLESIFPAIEHRPYHDFETAKENINDFHFVDIDQDKNFEILYNGHNGGEGEMVMIIKKSDNETKILQTFFGRVMNFDNTSMSVFDYSCCGGYVDHLQYFEYDKHLKEFIIQKDYAVSGSLPDKLSMITPIDFTVRNDNYNMRFDPEIETNLNPNSYPFDLIQNQNISAVFKKGDKGTAIAQETDNTGRIWWLVVMHDKPDPGKSIFYEGNNEFFYFKTIGWMSSRYLDYK